MGYGDRLWRSTLAASLAVTPVDWCGPNIAAPEGMLQTAGFKRAAVFASIPLPPDFAPEEIYTGWATLHAWM